MPLRPTFLPVSAVLVACTLIGPAQADQQSERIDKIFAEFKPDAPGCAVAVLHQGKVIHQRGYGRAHLEWESPITPATVFPVASVSKQFTALAVALLAEQGKLSLDDDVRKHVPELPDHGAVITLRQLLQHTSGLRDVWYVGGYAGWRMGDVVADRDVLALAVRQKGVNFKPGQRFAYNGTGYSLAGIVVQRVWGQSLRAFADSHIFKPLGMTATHFHDDHREVVKHRAMGYSLASGRPRIAAPRFDAVGPTGVFTTLEDLARWDRNFDEGRVGGKSAMRELLAPARLNSGATARYGPDDHYGLGLLIGSYRGLKTIWHSGIDWGYRAEFLRFPRQRFTVIILGNVDTLDPSGLARRVADVCLAKEFPEGPEDTATGKEGPVKLSPEQAAAWAGTYWNLDTGASWTFNASKDKLFLGGRELTPLAAERFKIDGTPIELAFTPATAGTQRKLTWVDVDAETFVALPKLCPTEAELKPYAGAYWSDELHAMFTVVAREGKLGVRGWRDDYGPLQPVLADGFSLRPPSMPSAFVRFTRDERKQVTGFSLSTTGCKDIGFVKRSD